jgi:hypothetical protein
MTRRNLKILALSIAIVILLTALQYRYLSPALFYLLFPGDVLELIINGPHGGSLAEEGLAPVLGFFTNVCAYWLILTCVVLAVRAVRDSVASSHREEKHE